MSMRVKVSIVCAWYERADQISSTLDSLLSQDYSSFEIVVVNDGSPDPKVRKMLDGYKDSRLRVIHQNNMGFTRALKVAISMAKGELIAIQGAGDTCDSSRISEQAAVFDGDPNVGIVGCYYKKKNIKKQSEEIIKPKDTPLGVGHKLAVSHGELMYRRSVYERVGGYREFFTVGQGSDLWARMLEISCLSVVKRVLYEQRVFGDGVSKDYNKIFHRSLLHGFMLEERETNRIGYCSPISDAEGVYMPLYSISRKYISRRYLTIVFICFALQLPEREFYRRLAVANASCLYSLFAKMFKVMPLKQRFSLLFISKSEVYKRLKCDM